MIFYKNDFFRFSFSWSRNIELTVTDNSGNNDTDTLKVTVIEKDTEPPIADAGEDIIVHIGEPFTLNASESSDNIGIVSYEWDLDNGEFIEGEKRSYFYGSTGTFNVELTVIDKAGNSDTDTVKIKVLEEEDEVPPDADAGEDMTVEVGEEFTLDASGCSDNEGIVSYTWYFEASTKNVKICTHSYSVTGTCYVKLVVTDESGNQDDDIITIKVEKKADEENDDSDGGISGFTLITLLVSISIAGVYIYKKKKRWTLFSFYLDRNYIKFSIFV